MSLLQSSFQRRLESISAQAPDGQLVLDPNFRWDDGGEEFLPSPRTGKWKSSLRSIHRTALQASVRRCGAPLATLQIKRMVL